MRLLGNVSQAQRQGPRDHQEDRVVHFPFTSTLHGNGHLLGVLDGHGGFQTADLCARAIPKIFNPEAHDLEVELSRLITALTDRSARMEMGSTLALALVLETEQVAIVATLGDSPVVVVDASRSVRIGEIHNARSNLREREAAICRGGLYHEPEEGGGFYLFDDEADIQYGLQITRSLGDCHLQRVLDRTPTITRYPLGRRSVVVVTSDGVLDSTMPHESLANAAQSLVRLAQKNMSAEMILRHMEERGLQDNASLIVWRPEPWWKRWF